MNRLRYIIAIIIPVVGLLVYMNITNKNMNEMALQLFTWVKKVKGNEVDLERLNNKVTIPIDHGIWGQLLRRNVGDTGLVNYLGFQKDENELDHYLSLLSNNPPSAQWSNNEKLAYWINAYNAFTVKLILNHYPVESIKDIAGNLPMINSPWDIKFFKIGGIDFDLNTIEHEILRKKFDEPRIHFAINCASVSCPVLRQEAYDANILESQLEYQARLFVNDTTRNIIKDDNLRLSRIFEWFKSDFTKKSTLTEYISLYTDYPINKKLKVSYLDYDWRLNEIYTIEENFIEK